MDRRSLGLAPTSPRPTMRAILITACLFATVPSAEALTSLPSISSSTGIAVAVVSVAIALSLVVGLAFMMKKFLRKFKKGKEGNAELGQEAEEGSGQPAPIVPPQPIAIVKENEEAPVAFSNPCFGSPVGAETQEEIEDHFYEALQGWNKTTDKYEFHQKMVEEFPGAVTPAMAMDALFTMIRTDVYPDSWMRMLSFTLQLERDLYNWDQTGLKQVAEKDKTIPSHTHQRFQDFLLTYAEVILKKYGDMASPKEGKKAGFMRFIAFLFGFVCKYERILKVMDATWTQFGLAQTDASRAVVWGYMRWKEDPRIRANRAKGHYTSTESNGNYTMFNALMEELRATSPDPRHTVGSKAQHLLFALGFGYEPDSEAGPLAYMSEEESFRCDDYLWLMMGRDLAMGNAWEWMCKEELSEHDRFCDLFGQRDSGQYARIVEMVMKYEQDHEVADDEKMEAFFKRYWMGVRSKPKIDFIGYNQRYHRYQRGKRTIGFGIKAWLLKNVEEWDTNMKQQDGHFRVAGGKFVITDSKSSKKGRSKCPYDVYDLFEGQ